MGDESTTDIWAEFVKQLSNKNGMLGAQLENTHLIDFDDDVVKIEIPIQLKFMAPKLYGAQSRIAKYLKEYWGKDYAIEIFVAGEQYSETKIEEPQTPAPAKKETKRKTEKDPHVVDIVNRYLNATRPSLEDTLTWLFSKIESPIEKAFLDAVLQSCIDRWIDLGYGQELIGETPSESFKPDIGHLFIWAQREFKLSGSRYRADFVLMMRHEKHGSHSIIVECDGHDFHEKTKAQAQRDKKRDRQFVRQGHRVIRFTGSEIHGSAMECAGEAIDLVMYPVLS